MTTILPCKCEITHKELSILTTKYSEVKWKAQLEMSVKDLSDTISGYISNELLYPFALTVFLNIEKWFGVQQEDIEDLVIMYLYANP